MKKSTVYLIIAITCIAIATTTFAQEDWEKDMRKDFSKVLKAKKDAPQKHREFIVKWREKGHLSDVTLLYETQKVNYPEDATFFYGLGYSYALTDYRTDNTAQENAIKNYEIAIELDPTLYFAHYSLGAVYKKQEKYDEALTKFQTCLSINPEYYPAHYAIGEVQLGKENYDKALQSFEAAQILNPKWEYPVYGIGLVYFQQGDLNKARETFERAIQNNRKFAPAYIKLGQVLAKEGFYEDAQKEYQKAAEYQPYSATDLYELAAIYDETGNIDGAIQLYQRALEIDPNYGVAHFAVAEHLYAKGDKTTAVTHYQRAIENDPTIVDNFFQPLEQYFIGLIDANKARAILEKAITVLPNDPRCYFYMGRVEVNTSNVDKAIENYEKTLEIINADPSYLEMELLEGHFNDSYLKLGDLYRQKSDLETAATYYKKALELDPSLAQRFINQGKTAFDAGNYNDAIEPLNVHVILFPEDIEANYLLGQSYEGTEDTENALLYYDKTLQLDPKRTDVLYKVVNIHITAESHQDAIDALKKIIAIDPSDANAHYMSANSYLALEQHDDALSAFLETIRLTPDNVDAQYKTGTIYEMKGDIDNAIVYYEKTIALDPETAEPFFKLGAIYEQREDEDNMIRVYQPALVLEPNHPNVQHKLAVTFEKRFKKGAEEQKAENLQHALHHYGLANEHDPEHFEWHFRYAQLLDGHAATLEDYHKHAAMAVDEYSATIRLKPDLADAYFKRAMITNRYKRIGQKLYRSSNILEDFKQVVLLEPKNVDAYFHMGTLQLWMERFTFAKETFQKVLKLKPNYKGVHTQLGKLAEREEQWEKAIELYEKEISINKEATEALQRLGDLYYNSQLDFNKAKDTLEKALELDNTHVPTIIVYANVLYSMDRLGGAADQFERAIQLEPRNLTANYNLALMYEYSDRNELAISQWREFLKLNPPEQWKLDAEKRLRDLGAE